MSNSSTQYRKKIFVQSLTKSTKYLKADNFLKPIINLREPLVEDNFQDSMFTKDKKVITANEYQKFIDEVKKGNDQNIPEWALLAMASHCPNIRSAKGVYIFKK